MDKVTHENYAFVDVRADSGLGFMDVYAAFDKTFGEARDSKYIRNCRSIPKTTQTISQYTFWFQPPNPDPAPDPIPGEIAKYSAAETYTAGDRVSYKGSIYEAKLWTKGDTPDSAPVWVKQ